MPDDNVPFPTIWYQPTLLHDKYPIITLQANVTLYVPQKIVKDVVIARDALGNSELLRTGSSQVPIWQWLEHAPRRLDRIVAALDGLSQGIAEPF